MIPITDLRCGNYIASGKEFSHTSVIGKVLEIGNAERQFEQIYVECEESFEWFFNGNYCGIPITKELLIEKCGWEVDRVTGWPVMELRIICSSLAFIDGRLYMGNGTACLYHIQYLHKLQNLFYSLTGQEMAIKL